MKNRFYGIRFPFKKSNEGFYFDLTTTSKDEVKSNLLHLLMTRKGRRLMRPDFGTNVMDFLFEPNDEKTINDIENEIVSAVQTNIPGINIDSVSIDSSDKAVNLTINYSYNDGLFLVKDILSVNF